jgi:ABC-type antimicrobial peptide transport system permease subunit
VTFKDLVKTALRNVGRHRVRTILSAVGVTVGILTMVTMVSLGVGVHREIIDAMRGAGLETVRINPATEEENLFTRFTDPKRTVLITRELVEELRARSDVVAVSPAIRIPWAADIGLEIDAATLKLSVSEPPWGPQEPFSVPPELVAGEEISGESRGEIVLSTDVLASAGLSDQEALDALIGREVTMVLTAPRGETQRFPLRLTGVMKQNYGFDGPYFDAFIGTPDALAMKAWWYNDPDILANEGYDALTIKAASVGDAVKIMEDLEAQGFEVTSVRTMLEMVNKMMVVLKTMLGSVGGLALFVASVGIANTMVMAVYERTREIGILRAVGASRGDIRRLFTAEAALIGLIGGVGGTIGGWLLGLGLNRGILLVLAWQEISINGTFFVVTGWLAAAALAFATVVGLLAGLYPAGRAARLDPLDALRYE